jgi:TolB-like protein
VFELTPEGIKRDAEVDPAQSIAPQTARRMDRMIIAVMALALVYFGVDKFVLGPKRDAALAVTSAAQAHASAKAADATTPKHAARSIAVLPFVNWSTDPENEFFSDGLSEEILNSLARIEGMQVVGRTSSFQFKGKTADLRAIGEALGVATVLEGSVRREGERARITAQLIRTSDGIHLWSETYDRTVQDSLAVQLDIAEQVAGALNVLLDDKQRARMREAGVANVDAFIAYQKGWKLYGEAHGKPGVDLLDGLRAANVEFDRATTLEPDFFEAHFAKVDLYEHSLQRDTLGQAKWLEAQNAALATLELAAANSRDQQQRLLTLAERQMLSNDWRGLRQRIDAALQAPGCNGANWLPVFASAFGNADALDHLGERAIACDPLNSINRTTRLTVALANGKGQRALD